MITFYMIGVLIVFVLGCRLAHNEKNKKDLQYGMLAPLTLLSWISVVLIAYRLIKDKNCLA